MKRTISFAPQLAALLAIGWSFWELTFIWYRAGALRLDNQSGFALILTLATLIAPWVLLVSAAWLLTKRGATAALVMFGVFVFKFLQYLPLGVSSIIAITTNHMESTAAAWNPLIVFVVFFAGVILSWLAYMANSKRHNS